VELDRIGADYMELVRMKVGCTEADCREAVHTEPTINGNRIPAPEPKFGGVIKESLEGSKTWWPPRIVPPKGAPNILLIMTDDQGYGVSGTFGGVIPTPALDRIAKTAIALYRIQLHRALLTHQSSTDHRPKSPRSGLRGDHGAVDGFPRL
jgi:hypothetical protein